MTAPLSALRQEGKDRARDRQRLALMCYYAERGLAPAPASLGQPDDSQDHINELPLAPEHRISDTDRKQIEQTRQLILATRALCKGLMSDDSEWSERHKAQALSILELIKSAGLRDGRF
jgi:hypothetical protein